MLLLLLLLLLLFLCEIAGSGDLARKFHGFIFSFPTFYSTVQSSRDFCPIDNLIFGIKRLKFLKIQLFFSLLCLLTKLFLLIVDFKKIPYTKKYSPPQNK